MNATKKPLTEEEQTKSSSSKDQRNSEFEKMLETWYEEVIRRTMKHKVRDLYSEDQSSEDLIGILVELNKRVRIAFPIRSNDRKEINEATKRIAEYVKEKLNYKVIRIEHYAHGMKWIVASKEKKLNKEVMKDQSSDQKEELKEHGFRIGTLGNMCEINKDKQIEIIDRK